MWYMLKQRERDGGKIDTVKAKILEEKAMVQILGKDSKKIFKNSTEGI